jgi:small subunit ribosomal protein S16
MVRIRMQKVGRPHIPDFRVVATPGSRARDAAGLEVLGHYHPKLEGAAKITMNVERLKHWIQKGAQPSDTLRTVLKQTGVWAQVTAA